MPRYRYRTETLVGPWRDTRLQAEVDAVAVGQALLDLAGVIRWQVPGEIEVDEPNSNNPSAIGSP